VDTPDPEDRLTPVKSSPLKPLERAKGVNALANKRNGGVSQGGEFFARDY